MAQNGPGANFRLDLGPFGSARWWRSVVSRMTLGQLTVRVGGVRLGDVTRDCCRETNLITPHKNGAITIC